ncbi:MAG TPA: DUF1565 domain-containing protein [Candidatus Obscuribacterales bacterium]
MLRTAFALLWLLLAASAAIADPDPQAWEHYLRWEQDRVPERFATIAEVDFGALPLHPRLPVPDAGKDLFVSTQGKDANPGSFAAPLRTIHRALDKARPGGLIWVRGGSYTEGGSDDYQALVIEKPGLTLSAYPGEQVTLLPGHAQITYGISIQADQSWLNRLDIRGFATVAIELGNEKRALTGTKLTHIAITAPTGPGHDGVMSYVPRADPGQSAIEGLLLEDVKFEGVSMAFGCNYGPCRSVRFNHVRARCRRAESEDVDSGQDCIAFESGDNLVFYRTHVDGAIADGLDLKATRVAVSHSSFTGIGRNGLKLWHGGDVINSLVSRTGADAAIVFDGPGHYRLLNSLVARHLDGAEGAYTLTMGYDQPQGAYQLEIINSVFVQNSGPLWVPPQTRLSLLHNFWGAFASEALLARGEDELNRDQVERVMNHLPGCAANRLLPLDTVPVFADVANHDYRPVSSLLQDQGQWQVDLPDRDLGGQPRVMGQAPDPGVFEGGI